MAPTTPKRRGRPPNGKGGDGRKLSKTDNNPPEEVTETSQTVAAGQLRAFIERVERLQEEGKTIREDIKEVFAEMKGTGFDTTAVKALIRLRGMDQAQRQEREAVLDLYKSAIGMS